MSREYATHVVKLPRRVRLNQRLRTLRAIWQLRAPNPLKWHRRYIAMKDFSRKATRAAFFGDSE